MLTHRIFNTVLGLVTPLFTGSPEKPMLGVNVAFVWMGLNAGCWMFAYFCIPEMKGLELEQIDALYRYVEMVLLIVDLRAECLRGSLRCLFPRKIMRLRSKHGECNWRRAHTVSQM